MHYYPKNIGDYRRDTMNLSLLEHGVYTTLIDHYILNEEPISLDHLDVCWTIGARTDNEKTAVCLILSKFFIKTDEGYIHKRCDKEIAQYKLRADTARENGKKGGRPKPNNNPTLTQPLTNQEPITNNQKQYTKLFDLFWSTYPHRNAIKKTKKESLAWWNKQSLDTLTMVLDATKKYKKYIEKCHDDNIFDGGVPDPIRYLTKERFKDEIEVSKDASLDRIVIANKLYKEDKDFYNLTKEEQNDRINSYSE